jgi:hypothetical protein
MHYLLHDTPFEVQLAARLIYERFVNHEIDDLKNLYVHTFPVSIDSPLNWTDAEMDELEAEVVIPFDMALPVPVDVGYNLFKARVETLSEVCGECLEYESWIWAYLTVLSRSFR